MGNKNCLEKKELLILIFLTIISVLLRGYKYRITFMLPYTYKYLDPSLFTRDLAFFNYDLNLFFYMNAYLSQFFSYETIFFIGLIYMHAGVIDQGITLVRTKASKCRFFNLRPFPGRNQKHNRGNGTKSPYVYIRLPSKFLQRIY